MSEQTAKIKVVIPKGAKGKNLSVDALDSRTRELAWKTFIYADGAPLLCRSFKTIERKTEEGKIEKLLVLEIREDSWEIVEGE